MGYPKDLLSTRAVVRRGNFAIIPPTGLVNNTVPGIEGCRVSIIASPKMGASFVQYVIDVPKSCGTTRVFGNDPRIECFAYVVSGSAVFVCDGKSYDAPQGAYIYSPAGTGLEFRNDRDETAKLLLYKQVFVPLEGAALPKVCFGNVNDIAYREYDDMANVFIKDLLPVDVSFDMNMHILSFEPGACHPFVETHVQEHGMYILEGEGTYLLDDDWFLIRPEDYIWMGPFTAQAAYGIGRTNFTYIYSKDCNRDAEI